MIKRLGKAKRNKQGAILILVVLILALAMIFIASAMMLTQATRTRLYENTMSSQARLTVTAAAEVFLEALQTQEITDKQMDDMLKETPTRHTNNSDKIKMLVNGVPGMSNDDNNCTYLDLYYPNTSDTTTVYADFTTVIGDQIENVRVILSVDPSQPSVSGRFKNQIDIGGDVGAEQLRFTEGVGMTSPAKRAQGITDNTILLRGAAYEQSSSAVFYSDIVYAPGSVARWGGGNTFNGNMIFLNDAYLSSYSSGVKFNGDFYFVGSSDNKEALRYGEDSGWTSYGNDGSVNWGNFTNSNSFYFYQRTAQAESVSDNKKVQMTLMSHDCYFVGVGSDKFQDGKLIAESGSEKYYITNKDTSFPGSTSDAQTPAGRMEIYKKYDYNPSSDPFPTNCTKDVLSTINYDGSTTVLTSDKTFTYDNYGTDGTYYPAGTEIAKDTEIITHPVTATYPEYLKKTESGVKVIVSAKVFDVGSLSTYDSDGDRIIDLNQGGAYYFKAGTTMNNNNNRTPYVFAINGSKQTILYFGSGKFNFNCCCFALYNVSATMSPVIIIMEDGAEFVLAGDSQYQVGNDALCSAGFLSLDRGFSSATGIGKYIQNHGHTSENVSWTQANGDEVSYSSLYDGDVRPNIYIYGVKNNKFTFGNDNIIEAYIGIYDSPSSGSGFYSASNGAHAYIYGRLEGMRITNGTSDSYCMPYCPAPGDTDSLPDKRPAETKYKVANIIYYYGVLEDAEPESET